ncbi:hypothetical protein [Rhodococcoides fascians]|uniref:hypothetical protein n=1 Tax=Rhodococcoides fascians TaxID=1828 RepID=UPI00050C7934|nr:hypothetical protein [Rhodococcus fascians]
MSENRFADAFGVEELIGQLVGTSSMLWKHVELAGEFESTEAAEVMREAIERLSQMLGTSDGTPSTPAKFKGSTMLRQYVIRITDGGIDAYSPGISNEIPQERYCGIVALDAAATASLFIRRAGHQALSEKLADLAVEIGEVVK